MLRTALLGFVSLGLVLGCSGASAPAADDPATAAAEALDAAQTANDEGAAIELATEGSDSATVSVAVAASGIALSPPSAEAIAVFMEARFGANLQPPTCHSATNSGAVDVFTFNDCTGPRGLTHTSGAETVVYSVDAQGIHTNTTSSGLLVNQSTLDIDATSTYSSSGGVHTLIETTQSSGTGPLGHDIGREGSSTETWTSTCRTINGTWTTFSNGRTGNVSESQVTRCDGHCPESGGSVSDTHRNGVSVTIAYDGSAIAHWTTGTRSGTLTLSCTPETQLAIRQPTASGTLVL